MRERSFPVPRLRWMVVATVALIGAGVWLRWWTARTVIREFERLGGRVLAKDQAPGMPPLVQILAATDAEVNAAFYADKYIHFFHEDPEPDVFTARHAQLAAQFGRLSMLFVEDSDVPADALEAFSNTSKLRHITICGCRLEAGALRPIGTMTGLDFIRLDRTNVVDEDVRYLLSHPGLRILSLYETNVGDAGAAYLGQIPQLLALHLDYTAVTDDGLRHLGGLVHLEGLSLSGLDISDAGLAHLSRLTRLHRLELYGSPRITDEGLKHLAGMVALEELNLSGTSVTDAGFAALERLPALRTLQLNGTGVTAEGIAKFERGRTIVQWWAPPEESVGP